MDLRSTLTDGEMADLQRLAAAHAAAKAGGDFQKSDAIRAELMEYGAWPPESGWNPVFETPDHRQKRLTARG